MGVYQILQKVRGLVVKTTNRVLFNKFDYVVVSDRTTDPFTTVSLAGIELRETPIARAMQILGGRVIEFMQSGGQLSREAQPFFLVSRESLKSGATYYPPTMFDTFTPAGLTTPEYRVRSFIEIGTPPHAWLLIVENMSEDYARG